MGTGPILIFDKSLIEALSPDESVWLGQFYRVNMTPLFLVETLADLEKEVEAGRTPEQVVGRLAEKTSVLSADPNTHHSLLCLGELTGAAVEMQRFVVLSSGRSVIRNGKEGVVFDRSREAQAVDRWRRRRFLDAEREFARSWRDMLDRLDLEALYKKFQPVMKQENHPRNLKDVKAFVDNLLLDANVGERVLSWALETCSIPYEAYESIYKRWIDAGKPAFRAFAPYTAHVLSVDLFFALSVAGGFIAKERPSNKVDMAYLYYLPFCMVFASMDKLHARTVPLFMQENQQFIWGADLKTDLKRLDEHYSKLPEEVKATGVMKFAGYPPTEGEFFVTRLWDRFMSPIWRQPRTPPSERSEKEQAALRALMQEIKEAENSPSAKQVHVDDAAFVVIKSAVPPRLGKWQIVPPESIEPQNN
jgi:hypothetical protein